MSVSREFIVEKLKALFPQLNTDRGSRVDTILIKPLLSVFAEQDTSDFLEFLKTRVEEYDPDIITSEGSANYDILIGPLSSILEPLQKEINNLRQWQSLKNYQSMPTEEMDSLVANFFLTRNEGAKSTGTVRVYFNEPVTAMFNTFSKFLTKSGLAFVPSEVQMIQADVMSFNQEGNLYYVDVLVEAEEEGLKYNILSGQIISAENLPVSYVKVVNMGAFTGGSNKETNEALYTRSLDAITVRNLVSKKSIRHNILSSFPRVEDIQVVGAGDSEMERDLEPFGINTTTTVTQVVSGGRIISTDSVSTSGTNYIHVLGKSDVHIYTQDYIENYIDLVPLSAGLSVSLSSSPPYQVSMPLLRVVDVERLDPVYLTQTGQYIPYAHPIDARVLRDFYFSRDDQNLERAVGTVRVFFERPTKFNVDETTTFTTDSGLEFRPIYTQSITASGMSLNSGQSITKTEMDTNIIYNQDIVYYYTDISVQSINAGDENSLLASNTFLRPFNYTSEGWSLSSADTDYSFSVNETLRLSFTSTFNDGISIDGEAARVIYEYVPTVQSIQDYVDGVDIRVVTTDILIKHFQPAYVDIALQYEGSVEEDDVELQVRNYINRIGQGDYFEISDLVSLLYEYGVTRIVFPVEVFTLILGKERTYTAKRFTDRYKTDKRVHFIARNVDITKI